MSTTEFGTNSPQAVKRWSLQGVREVFQAMGLQGMIGTSPGSAIHLKTELNKDPGDEIRYDLLMLDRGNGVDGDATLEGYEDDLNYEQDTLKINQKRKGTAFRRMSQQRTIHDLRKDGRHVLTQWGRWFLEGSLFAHLAGVAGDDSQTVAGALGATTNGDTDWAGNQLGIDASNEIDAGHLVDGTGADFSLDLIDNAVLKAKVADPYMAPLSINGQDRYVMYLHPQAVTSLRKDSAAQRAVTAIWADASVRGNKNPIYTGALGEYNGVILRENRFVPRVSTVSHNLMLGRSAGCIAFGNAWETTSRVDGGGGAQFEILEEARDFKNRKAMALAMCAGVKRSEFNSKAFGVISVQSTDNN